MVSSPNRPNLPASAARLGISPAPVREFSEVQREQMFRLIDSILPFEACLYHQFLPLAIEGKHLKLGMVSPDDSSALSYVRHILAYLNCSLRTEPIEAQSHQAMLSAYLQHSQAAAPPPKPATQAEPHSEKPTFILDKPSALASTPTAQTAPSFQNEQPPSAVASRAANDSIQERPLPEMSRVEALPPLEVQGHYLTQPIERLATLAPPQLLQELLGRVLIRGIGRLYFERQSERGRILWSQEGVLQSALELTLPAFQGVIIELKRTVGLPLLPVFQAKQVEIERRYQQECLLLRLRVMPGTYGEEATLQVLRGIALKFYQRQKLETLSQEALKLAQQLQQKLSEISDRVSQYPMPLEAIPALDRLLQGLDRQVATLSQQQISPSSEHFEN
jgi:type II secretory ATPase GspE/PulE/Tfp pilus assembly ATPase PilB-like protein